MTSKQPDPLAGVFKYYQVSVAATALPGYGRLDPLAVVYTGGAGSHTELGRTRALGNQWNPSFPEVFFFPCDSAAQNAADIRVDFYNKHVRQDRFLGTAQCQLTHVVQSNGVISLPFMLAETGEAHASARVTITAVQAYNKPSGESAAKVRIALELEQTNFYGVSQKAFFEVSRAAGEGGGRTWTPVCMSPVHGIDPQGWCQFPPVETDLRQLALDQPGTPLMVSLYRHRTLGRGKRLLGHFQMSLQEVLRMNPGNYIAFTGNARENLLAANVRLEQATQTGSQYDVTLKLVNVRWRADEIPPPQESQ
jgi:C2 domain